MIFIKTEPGRLLENGGRPGLNVNHDPWEVVMKKEMTRRSFLIKTGLMSAGVLGSIGMFNAAGFFSPEAEAAGAGGGFRVVDTNQNRCYDASGRVISPPRPGEAYYGQDAQFQGLRPAYRDNNDGTITDLNTGLMWQKTPGEKMSWDQAAAGASSFSLAGHNDWRLPSIKELYSLMDFTGYVKRTARDSKPYIDTRFFDFKFGDASRGERIIDCQYWSSTRYVGTTMNGSPTAFGVNFADGRIKGYPTKTQRGVGRRDMRYVRYVRGSRSYGINKFVNNGNGTVTDLATGLMWMQLDSGALKAGPGKDGKMNWEQALAWADGLSFAGYSDWRLPNAKELQSIVDYRRSPQTSGGPAIDPVFRTTAIIDEGGRKNYPYFWTGTTHIETRGAQNAVYVAFGEALGFMRFPGRGGRAQLMDVHGAGSQRSDPKTGDPTRFPTGRGPQGDVIRIYNFARLVRRA